MRPWLLIFFYSIFIGVYSQNSEVKIIDSINDLLELSSDQNLPEQTRINYAKNAVKLAQEKGVDSIILKSGRSLAFLYYEFDKNTLWEERNKENLELAFTLSDTSALAVTNFNLGLAKQFYKIELDSAYFYYKNAIKYYNYVGDVDIQATIFMYIADIQKIEKDYIGAEENVITAIKLFSSLPETESVQNDLWSLNNSLGIISKELKRYDESLEYHDKAYKIADRMKDGGNNKTISINNQASAHRELLDYEKALELYNSLISMRNIYEDSDPTFYPLIIDNIAYTKILAGHTDYDKISSMFYEAYKMSDSLGDDITKLAVTIDLSKFYKHLKEKDSTLKYADNAYKISKKISNNDILLESMILLSELKEGKEGKSYLNEHIKLTDSLLQVERNVRNKYARIELETDQIEEENAKISKENLYLLILSIGLLFSAILIFVVISQRARNKQLRMVQAQQKANEEIYNLMLNQQDKVDEARSQEKIRVSKELHDGVLGRLFGTRLSLDSLNFVEGKEAIMNRANYIGQLKTIEEDIRKISHEMSADFVSGSSFMNIVSELIENQTKAYKLSYDFDYTDDISWEIVPNKTKINIYRILQESMQNIYKHAEAKHINISILLKNSLICLDIKDDGKGFDTSKGKKGIGLKNMTSRVAEINGKIELTSKISKGTEVKVRVPYTS